MERMSKIKPDNMKAGKKVTMIATWPATNWFFASIEINNPMPSAAAINSAEASSNTQSEPCRGTSNTQSAIATVNSMPPMPRTK